MAKSSRPKDKRLRSVIIDEWRRNGSVGDLGKVKVWAYVDNGGSFKTTFNALGMSTRGSLLINTKGSGFNSDGTIFSAVLSSRQPTSDGQDFIKKLKKKKK